jgi:hypothetical protein
VLVLATSNSPDVELSDELEDAIFKALPVVREFALIVIGDCVVAVDQFQV